MTAVEIAPAATALLSPCGTSVAAWGQHGTLHGRDEAVRDLLAERGVQLHHLGSLTTDGHPRHPLRQPASAQLAPLAAV